MKNESWKTNVASFICPALGKVWNNADKWREFSAGLGREHHTPSAEKMPVLSHQGKDRAGLPSGPWFAALWQIKLPRVSVEPHYQWLVNEQWGLLLSVLKKKITKISSPDTQAPLTDVIPCKTSEKMEMLQNNKQRKESTYPNPLTQMALEGQCGLTCLNSFCSQSNATALGWRREKEKSIINAAWPCSWFSQRTRPFNGGGKMARG